MITAAATTGAAGRRHADLVDADDAVSAVAPEGAFVAEGRDDRRHRTRKGSRHRVDCAGRDGGRRRRSRRPPAAGEPWISSGGARAGSRPCRRACAGSTAGRGGPTPWRTTSIFSMRGLLTLNVRSTPTPLAILRTVIERAIPPPRRRMTVPSKTWMRSVSPSTTLADTLDGVARRELGQVGADLVRDDLVEHVHVAVPAVVGSRAAAGWGRPGAARPTGRPAAEYSMAASSRPASGRRASRRPRVGSSSEDRSSGVGSARQQVRPSLEGPPERCSRAASARTAPWLPPTRIAGTPGPRTRRSRVLRILEEALGERLLDRRRRVDGARAAAGSPRR